jgi:hypothetical protein
MEDRETELRHLLVAAAHAHHAVYGGPNSSWPRWYAEWMYGQLMPILPGEPTVDRVEQWLVRADARYTDGTFDQSWPHLYAQWILDWADGEPDVGDDRPR